MQDAERHTASVPEPSLPSTVYTVSPDALVSEVAQLMVAQGVGDVIVAEDQRPVGILTDRDIVVRVLGTGSDAKEVRVRAVMSQPPVTISHNAEVSLAIELMGRHGIRRLPIVDEERRLVSILTMDDVILLGLNGLPAVQDIVRRQLRREAEPRAGPAFPEARPSAQDVASRAGARALSGQVASITRPAVVVPMGRGLSYPYRRRRFGAARAWFFRNRLWLAILLLLSLIGVATALFTDYYGRAFYKYDPLFYEPKDIERHHQILKEQMRDVEEEIRKREERKREERK